MPKEILRERIQRRILQIHVDQCQHDVDIDELEKEDLSKLTLCQFIEGEGCLVFGQEDEQFGGEDVDDQHNEWRCIGDSLLGKEAVEPRITNFHLLASCRIRKEYIERI